MALSISPSPFGTLSVTVAETEGSITVNTVATAPAVLTMALGVPGPAGAAGADGQPGVGVPAGGTTGQSLVKTSGTDYATGWASMLPLTGGSLEEGATLTLIDGLGSLYFAADYPGRIYYNFDSNNGEFNLSSNGITGHTNQDNESIHWGVSKDGILFPDGTTQNTASIPGVQYGTTTFNDSDGNGVYSYTITNDPDASTIGKIRLTALSTNQWIELRTDNDSDQALELDNGVKVSRNGYTFADGSTQASAFVPSNYLTASSIAATYLSQSSAASTYFPKPTGTTSQYIDGTGGLVTFPTVGTAGKMTMTAYNATGATIPQGSVVYISGAHGNDPQISLAKADSEATSAFTIAVAQSSVPNNSNGTFITTGLLEGFATNGFGADGTPLYLSPTVAGGLTATKPFAPYHYVRVGTVVRSHPTQGTVFISIINGFQLDEMSDVASTAPLNNNVLTFESSSGMWKDKSVSTALGYAPANQTLGNLTSSSTARTNLGLGTMAVETASNYLTTATAASVYTTKANNLSDLASASTARTNLGLAYATDAQVIAGTSASTVLSPAQAQYGLLDWTIPGTLSTAVSTGTVTSTGYGSRCTLTPTASGQYAIVYPQNGSITGFTTSATQYGDCNFSKRIKIYGRLTVSPVNNVNCYYAWGRSNNTASTIGSPAAKGFGIRIQGTGPAELQVHNGTTLTSVTSSFTPTTQQTFDCLIDSLGDGNVNLYINGSQVATSGSGPTGTGAASFPLLIQEVSSTGSNASAANFYSAGRALYMS